MVQAVLLALLLLGAASPALAQANKSDYRPIDLKPLLPPILPPLPSNSALGPGAVGTGAGSPPHSSSLYDSPSTTQPARV